MVCNKFRGNFCLNMTYTKTATKDQTLETKHLGETELTVENFYSLRKFPVNLPKIS